MGNVRVEIWEELIIRFGKQLVTFPVRSDNCKRAGPMVWGRPLNSHPFLPISDRAKLRGFKEMLEIIAFGFLLWVDGGASLL
jgi:hypothetical protein